jgi:transposase
MRPLNASWHDTCIALVQAGLTRRQAAYVLGVDAVTIRDHANRFPDFQQRLAEAAPPRRYGRRPNHEWPVDIDALLRVVKYLIAGAYLKYACERADVSVPTLKRWRRRFEDVDRLIVAASMGPRRVQPYSRLVCPGSHCGTKTGYDYGCDREPCRSEVARLEWRRRHPDAP